MTINSLCLIIIIKMSWSGTGWAGWDESEYQENEMIQIEQDSSGEDSANNLCDPY